MSMFNYERGLHCDRYIFKDTTGDIGDIVALDDRDVCIFIDEEGWLLSR